MPTTDGRLSMHSPLAKLGAAWRAWAIVAAAVAVAALAFADGPPEVYGQAATATATATPILRTGGKFEENDPELLYSGSWTTINDSRASGGSFRRASAADASVQLRFLGPSIRLVTTKGPDRGIARIFI